MADPAPPPLDVDAYEAVITRRIGRAIKTILGGKERLLDPHLAEHDRAYDASAAFRKIVQDELRDVEDVLGALLEAIAGRIPGNNQVVVNQFWLEAMLTRAETPVSAIAEAHNEHAVRAG